MNFGLFNKFALLLICNKAESISTDQHLQTNDNVEIRVLPHFTDNRNDYTSLNAYTIIKNIFLKYNTPSPSSAPVERLFSFTTTTNLSKEERLTNKMFEQKIVLKANLLNKPKL